MAGTLGIPADCKDPPLLKVMYLFAGKHKHSDIGSFLRKAETNGTIRLQLLEFNIERSPDHALRDASWSDIHSQLSEGCWFLIVSPSHNTFSRARFQYLSQPGPRPLRNITWPKGFPWLSLLDRQVVEEANQSVSHCLEACQIAHSNRGHFVLGHPEDLGAVEGERPASIWQWPEFHDLVATSGACSFAVHQCAFGSTTTRPTRFATSFPVSDPRCHESLPRFDKFGRYLGPLPRKCGHQHATKLIGKTQRNWHTSASGAYPPRLCQLLAQLILHVGTSCGKGSKDKPRSSLSVEHPPKKLRVDARPLVQPVVPAKMPANPVATFDSVSNPIQGDGQLGPSELPVDQSPLRDVVEVDSQDGSEEPSNIDLVDSFDMESCLNRGTPMMAEWDNKEHEFIDGFGLCSPTRWYPQARGERRTCEMHELAMSTFTLLETFVVRHIGNLRMESFKLATGKLEFSPFPEQELQALRAEWFKLLPDPIDAEVLDDGQPFYLRALSQWLKIFKDPDVSWLVDERHSFATGVPLGVEEPLPRSPQVFPPKVRHRKLDDTEFNPLAVNYPSGQMSSKELEIKFREEEGLGRMYPSKLSVLKSEYGSDRVRVAAMAAIAKPDGSVRPLHDATHSVKVNHAIRYRDQIQCPGPSEIAAVVRESLATREAPFCLSADIKAAHRLVKVRRDDWGYMCCRADSSSDVIWVNKTGTFGLSSAPYWWAKLCALIGRFVGYMMQTTWFLHMIYVDDLHGVFVGERKFLNMWIWILAFEMVGTPFGYHKFRGGFASDFVGFHLRYDLAEVGISEKRGSWLVSWIKNVAEKRWVTSGRDFSEFLGRLGFVSQLLIWMKPHLAPLFAWSAVTGPGTVGCLPDSVILTLKYLLAELETESFTVSARAVIHFPCEAFRTDAKCTDTLVVLGGWEMGSRRWFSLKLSRQQVPFLFRDGAGSQWASTSAELLAILVALHCFDWLVPQNQRRSATIALAAGTDNQANQFLSIKRSSTRWPLMAVNMQLSAALSKARLSLRLKWRPREENQEADDLTNDIFTRFDLGLRVAVAFEDLDLRILEDLMNTRLSFEASRASARAAKAAVKMSSSSKRFDKSAW